MNKALRVKVVDMLLDQKFRNEAVAIMTELVKTHPSAVVAAYEKVVVGAPEYEIINGHAWGFTELNHLCNKYNTVVALMRSNQKVDAVKEIRAQYGFGLREAVQILNYAQHYAEVHWIPEGTLEPTGPQVDTMAREIAAVIKKFY